MSFRAGALPPPAVDARAEAFCETAIPSEASKTRSEHDDPLAVCVLHVRGTVVLKQTAVSWRHGAIGWVRLHARRLDDGTSAVRGVFVPRAERS